MTETKTRKSLFERLKTGLEEGIAHAKGELTLKTTVVPEAPPEIDAKTLATALKGASEEISQKVLENLSKRGREMVTEVILGYLRKLD